MNLWATQLFFLNETNLPHICWCIFNNFENFTVFFFKNIFIVLSTNLHNQTKNAKI